MGKWFDLVTGILLFRVLLGFGPTLDGPNLELSMDDPNTAADWTANIVFKMAASLAPLNLCQDLMTPGKAK